MGQMNSISSIHFLLKTISPDSTPHMNSVFVKPLFFPIAGVQKYKMVDDHMYWIYIVGNVHNIWIWVCWWTRWNFSTYVLDKKIKQI